MWEGTGMLCELDKYSNRLQQLKRQRLFHLCSLFDIYVVITGPCVVLCVCWRLRPLVYICAPLYTF